MTAQACSSSGSSSCDAAAGAWGPCTSGPASAAAAAGAAATGAPYTFHFTAVPAAAGALRCTLALQLVRYADPGRQATTLHYDLPLPQPPMSCLTTTGAQPEAQATAAAASERQGQKPQHSHSHAAASSSCTPKEEEQEEEKGTAAGRSTTAGSHVLSFVSQEVQYCAERIAADFSACPPDVVLPQARSKKPRTAEGAAAAAAAGEQVQVAAKGRAGAGLKHTQGVRKSQRVAGVRGG